MPRKTLLKRVVRFIRFWQHLTPATFREVLHQAGAHRLPGLAAEIAYNGILALFPAILMLITAIGLVDFSQNTLNEIGDQISRVAPTEVVLIVEDFIGLISNTGSQQLLSASFLATLWAASGAASAAMSALDQIHRIPKAFLRPFWLSKLVSLGLTLGTLQLLILASVLIFISDLVVQLIATHSGVMAPWVLTAWRFLSLPTALGIVAIAAAFLYRYGPSRWQSGTPILPGAMLAAGFWAFLSGLFRLYLAHFGNYNRAYGTVGTFIVLLLWLQLSSLMLLIGAQLNVTVGEVIRRTKRAKNRDRRALDRNHF